MSVSAQTRGSLVEQVVFLENRNIELVDRVIDLEQVLSEILSQIDQGGDSGKVFARDHCIQRARKIMEIGA